MILERLRSPLVLALFAFGLGSTPAAQEEAEAEERPARTMHVYPEKLELQVGEMAQLEVVVLDAQGEPEEVPLVFFTRSRGAVRVSSEGQVHAMAPGDFNMTVRTASSAGERVSVEVRVVVTYAPVESVAIEGIPAAVYAGTVFKPEVRIVDAAGVVREDLLPRLESSDESVASFDAFGRLEVLAQGRCTLATTVEGIEASATIEARPNPVTRLELDAPVTLARTGDVLHFAARALTADGQSARDVPIVYSVVAQPDDDLGPAATGQVDADGRFVASAPGLYTVFASCGNLTARASVRCEPRDAARRVKLVGHGLVSAEHTSDLWVWEGVDGRDYAVTGTWGANGDTIFWDVTDPSEMQEISRVTVDARTVNDVKVHPNGRLCVISREGASNRKNGIVLIDVTNPREPSVISEYTEGLTGGVHNLFIWNDHVFALSNGQRYDIVDIEDPANPRTVSSFELETPGHSIHDVWVVDGIAYSSNWRDGVYMVDVGNGVAGGTIENPVVIGSYAYPSGWNHAAFPYFDEKTGKFYVIAGDEAFPFGLNIDDKPTYPRGWLHFIDFTDPKNPVEVARYEVPEAGTHNLWVEDEVLYVAYYNGGVRVVDISGELMGNLYEQGREIGSYLPADPEGRIANAPMTWGPQPHKGKVFFSDWNSGLWAIEVEQPIGE